VWTPTASQFAIRDPRVGLFRPLLGLVAEELDRADRRRAEPVVRIAGVCGPTAQARGEAAFARECGYHAALLSLGALKGATEDELIAHCLNVAEVIPLVGFYLQSAAGGRVLPFPLLRRLVEVDNVVAFKIAPFSRYRTLDVVRAVAEAGRDDLALYTGNDDNIVMDLLTPFRFGTDGAPKERRMVGGLLGQWAVWTRRAVDLLDECHRIVAEGADISTAMLRLHVEVTDANAAIFDAANGFAGCIAGVHEVLRRQGLLEGTWCLDPDETLSPGQARELDRVCRAYPHLRDDAFVRENLHDWLRD
jgi:dihydrodipicolinate synthase/N-acetylneuraminate lyase